MKISPLRRHYSSCAAPLLFGAAFAAFIVPASAQLAPPQDEPVIGARMPALSPDGKTLAFVWRGDVWVSPATGGRAYSVTDHVELDAYPVFSPDGKWIAFSSLRNGNYDIFVVPTTGGDARQMTFSGSSEVATDWSPDGKTILFSAQRDVPNSTLFSLDVKTLRFTKLTEDYKSLSNAVYSPDGGKIVFQRAGFPWTRPRYNGSGAAQLWSLDLAQGKRTGIVDDEKQHLWPHFMPDGKSVACVTVGQLTPNDEWLSKPPIKFTDNASRTPNLWIFPSGGNGKGKQITQFVGGSVRCPDVAQKTGDIVFEHERDLYRLPAGQTTPQKLTLYCGAESKTSLTSRQVFNNSDVDEAEISPDGKTYGFVLKGDIWTIPTEKGKRPNDADAKQLTDYPGFDRDFVWGKDNKTVYFISDRNNNDRLFKLDSDTKKVTPIWTGTDDASSPKLCPDGSMVGFWVKGPTGNESDSGLWAYPTSGASAKPRRIVQIPGAVQGEFSWSPDMKWIAYTRRGVESRGVNIYLIPADGAGQAVNVTRLNSQHQMPTWSPDGKYLFFQSDRDGDGLYVLPLKPEDARIEDIAEIKFEKPASPLKVEINFEDTAQRIRKLPTTPVPDGDLTVTSDGQIFYVADGDVYRCGYDGKDAKKITNGGGLSSLRVSSDSKTLYFTKNNALQSLKMTPPYPVTPVEFTATLVRDLRAERHAAFNQLWRSYNTRFYDGNFHGRNWAEIRTRYEPLLTAVDTRDEFANLCNMMIGELEASHSEVGASRVNAPTSPVTRNLGVYFDYSYEGPGIKVKDVPDRAPGSYAKTRIKPGEYIMAVDGTPVSLDENLYKVLNDKGDRDFTLLVNDKPTRDGARTVSYRAVSSGEWSDIHYRNRTEMLRKMVAKESNDTLAYVHIQGMGGPNQTTFDRELYEYAEGKKGVIIDVRFNGGGNIADQLVNWLNTKPYGTIIPRNGFPIPAPGGFIGGGARSWDKPIVVLINEASFSNAEMFPDAMKATGLAKIVGMPTPGYVIWTSGLPLIDGTSARMPNSGQWRKDGSPLENMGEKPDVMVPLSTEDWLSKRDPQLDKAVQILMK